MLCQLSYASKIDLPDGRMGCDRNGAGCSRPARAFALLSDYSIGCRCPRRKRRGQPAASLESGQDTGFDHHSTERAGSPRRAGSEHPARLQAPEARNAGGRVTDAGSKRDMLHRPQCERNRRRSEFVAVANGRRRAGLCPCEGFCHRRRPFRRTRGLCADSSERHRVLTSACPWTLALRPWSIPLPPEGSA